MTAEETNGNAEETVSNAMTDRDLLVYLATQVDDIVDMCQGLLNDRLNEVGKRLDHADVRAHEIARKVDAIHADLEKYRPLLEKYSALQRMFTPKPKGR